MNKINWKVRFRNSVWLSGFISQTLILIQAIIVGLVGLGVIHSDLAHVDVWMKWLLGIFNLVLAYLSYLGIVIDPSVEGVGDSRRVLERETPLPEELKEHV
ncbi:phage holin [Priestia aryabhattai]|uniref:phage holin n=1 Tax=Priestia aryabhattai TaxID=412384 RepID=UPI001C8E5140|nr:phage holin [Priestia aryabhattai]MBY0077974.1 phage holin [Priestia aryabhattai]